MQSNIRVLLALLVSVAAVGCAAPAVVERHEHTSSALDRPPVPDADEDGSPDAEDCDPLSSRYGQRLLEDDLATANGVIAAAPGFSKKAWAHENGAYRQHYVRDASDASLFQIATDGDFSLEVTAAVTKTADFYSTFRQDFVIVGVDATAGELSGYGCGIELVGDDAWASIVKLSGDAGAVRTSHVKRVARDYVEVGEDVDIAVRLEGGKLTCTVKQPSDTTTIVALDVGPIVGSAGLYTRQSAALFKDARICRVKP